MVKKKKVAIVTKRNNGDIEYKVLNDMDASMKRLKWCIIFLVAAIVCPIVLKGLCMPAASIVSGLFATIAIAIFVSMLLHSSSLSKTEGALVTNIISDIVQRDPNARKQNVLKIKFCSDSLDSYGTIDEEYVLVLLGDNTVLKYLITQLRRKDERYNYKHISSNSEVCKNEKQKVHVLRESSSKKILRSASFVSFATWFAIICILGFGAGLMYLLLRYVQSAKDIIRLFIAALIIMSFVPLYELADKRMPRNLLCNGIRRILEIPIWLFSLTKLAMPFFTILIALLLMFAYTFLPVFAVVSIIEMAGYNITMGGKLFIILTAPLVIATHCSKYIRNFILRKTPFGLNDHHYHLFMRELIRFVYTKENLNFIIYAAYLFYLAISSFKNLQSGEPLLGHDMDMIILKSFLVFIACTNMLDRKKSSNLEGGALLMLFMKMMTAHDDDEWREKRKNHQLKD